MTIDTEYSITPPIEAAIDELERLILARFPDASFEVQQRFDPPGISLIATVDVEDTNEVFATVVDRLVDIQVNEGLPVYVVPLQPIERVIAEMNRQKAEANARFRLTG